MANLIKKIQADLKDAMKEKKTEGLSVLRMLAAAIRNKQIELKSSDEPADELVVRVLKIEVKKRKDSVTAYKEGGREDLADKELEEIEIINKYLPKEMSEAAVEEIVKSVISELGQVGPGDFGRVMGAVMGKVKDQADGKMVQEIVKRILND